jgi:hypothetical protein
MTSCWTPKRSPMPRQGQDGLMMSPRVARALETGNNPGRCKLEDLIHNCLLVANSERQRGNTRPCRFCLCCRAAFSEVRLDERLLGEPSSAPSGSGSKERAVIPLSPVCRSGERSPMGTQLQDPWRPMPRARPRDGEKVCVWGCTRLGGNPRRRAHKRHANGNHGSLSQNKEADPDIYVGR